MEKRTGRNWLRWMCAGLLCLSGMMNGFLQAEGVPPVIKYQAVLRDVEGEPMTERTGLAVRITLRQGTPGGTILYQETHTGLNTDAFGLLLLEIGRGNVANVGCASLSEVPWKNSPIYAQVEMQADDNGYTMMGASELLSVPYALYAGDAGVGFDLADGFLPKYSSERGGLVNSGISQFNDKIAFSFENGDDYTFPTTRGKKGEVLMLVDDRGTLEWGPGGGGSGGAGCEDCKDWQFVYWDATANKGIGALASGDLYYEPGGIYVDGVEFSSREATRLEGTVVVNATVSGDNNLQYTDLQQRNVWVGDANGKSQPHLLGSGVSIDDSDPNHPVLNFGGGVWQARTDAGSYYVYTNEAEDAPGKNLRVGVGTGDTPKARFHMQGGSFLLSDDGSPVEAVDFSAGYHFYWQSATGALRMGKLEAGSSLWADALAENSIALGTGAKARTSNNVAIGRDAEATERGALVFGQTARADGDTALALGTQLKVSGRNAVGIGSGYASSLNTPSFSVGGLYGVGIGYNIINDANKAIAIGSDNNIEATAVNSIVLGTGNNNRRVSVEQPAKGDYNIIIGSDNVSKGDNNTSVQWNVQMGKDLTIDNCEQVVNIGVTNKVKGDRSIAIGQNNTVAMTSPAWSGICIGYRNEITMGLTGIAKDWGPGLIGQRLQTYNNQDHVVVLGRFNADANFAKASEPALVVGAGTSNAVRKNVLELSDDGELRVPGTVYCNGTGTYSDSTLKTDIQPLDADYSVLRALQPVRYRFKADEEQTLQFGFIAQDVEQYFPHLVSAPKNGLKSLNYIGLLPVLWQYTQRLEQTVETQAAEIDRLKTELESLKGDIQAIKAAVGFGE